MSIDFKALRYCEAVARHKSITKAAQELRIAQPALSIAIKKLEEELGVILFTRQARQVTPSPEALLLMARAERIFEELALAREELQAASDLRVGEVKIGMPPMYGQSFLPKAISAFHRLYPAVALTVMAGSAESVKKMLDSGAIDIGMLEARRVPEDWPSVEVGRDETVLCVRADHPLASRKRVRAQDLDGLPMAVFDSTYLQRSVLEDLCAEAGIKMRIALQSNYVPLIREAVADGVGAANMLRTSVSGDNRIRTLSFEPAQTFSFRLCWRSARALTKASRTFLDVARKEAQSHR